MEITCENCLASIHSTIATTTKLGLCPICGCDTLKYALDYTEFEE